MLTNRASMRCIGIQVIPMGIGTAIVAMAMPARATHVCCVPAGGENSQSLWMQCAANGSANAFALPLGSSTGIAGFPQVPVPVPVNTDITSYSLRRNTTAAAIDYVVLYYSLA
jgi:hypothetical protein